MVDDKSKVDKSFDCEFSFVTLSRGCKADDPMPAPLSMARSKVAAIAARTGNMTEPEVAKTAMKRKVPEPVAAPVKKARSKPGTLEVVDLALNAAMAKSAAVPGGAGGPPAEATACDAAASEVLVMRAQPLPPPSESAPVAMVIGETSATVNEWKTPEVPSFDAAVSEMVRFRVWKYRQVDHWLYLTEAAAVSLHDWLTKTVVREEVKSWKSHKQPISRCSLEKKVREFVRDYVHEKHLNG